MPSSSTVVRQQPGYACEECRRRKARCDRVRPQCGFCVETGTACIIIEKRPQRGPKRGQLNAMRTRIGDPINAMRRDSDNLEAMISDLMRTDLDQLYFERVHPVVPMIHQRRYFAWADDENPNPARAGLRLAMRAMAAAMSAQFRSLADSLYHETLRLLETRSQTPTLGEGLEMPLEQIQAWLLLAHYEILRVNEHQAMITAGRAFRLVQMARLYELDREEAEENSKTASSDEEFAELEEKRRTFWLAFCLDRFLCSRNDWPLTLFEELARTRLPAPESNFQLGKRAVMGFLQDKMIVMAQTPSLPPFAETVVLATLHGRCMDHRRSSRTNVTLTESGVAGTQPDHDFWICHEWLTSMVEDRVQALSQIQGPVTDGDPMLLFARMLAHGALVHLNTTLQAIGSPWLTPERQMMITTAGWRAERAAAEMVRLARSVKLFSCFKVHPFLSDPLECATGFLLARQQAKAAEGIFTFDPEVQNVSGGGSAMTASMGMGDDGGVEHLLRVLRYLGDTNTLARDFLSRLGLLTPPHSRGGGGGRGGVKALTHEFDFTASACRDAGGGGGGVILHQAGQPLSVGWKRLASF
ncbi:hypothetical protein QBC43DRAFT_270881 [Cladorrhinum sp. PSN259]|nr:hypothetical protein QBC43DRAFT_270881 [Cladorrhinum sp. PSN259]